jgi:hypothetical protein
MHNLVYNIKTLLVGTCAIAQMGSSLEDNFSKECFQSFKSHDFSNA